MQTTANAKTTSDHTSGLIEFAQLAQAVTSSVKKQSVTSVKSVTKPRAKRKRFSFWLEMDKVGQVDLKEWFAELKRRREFAPVIRLAVSLYRELVNGRYEMLYQMFPETAPKPTPAPSPEVDELKKRVAILEGQVTILQQVIISQRLPSAIDQAINDGAGQGKSHTPRPVIRTRTTVIAPAVVMQEADTSTAFLDAF